MTKLKMFVYAVLLLWADSAVAQVQVTVQGRSMVPDLQHGQVVNLTQKATLEVDDLAYFFADARRGWQVKKVLGIPGNHIDSLLSWRKTYTLQDGSVFAHTNLTQAEMDTLSAHGNPVVSQARVKGVPHPPGIISLTIPEGFYYVGCGYLSSLDSRRLGLIARARIRGVITTIP